MIKIDLKTQIKILAVINILLLLGISITGYTLFLRYQVLKNHGSVIRGKLVYLVNISDPENEHVGVWLKIELENPKYVKIGKGDNGVVRIYNTTNSVGIEIKNLTNNRGNGFIVDVVDKNNNNVIDTGDLFHIYGRVLCGYSIMFTISGINGNIHTQIPSEKSILVNDAYFSGTMMNHLYGLSDAEEATYYNEWYPMLDAHNWDTDGDNFSDGREIREWTNPTNKYSHPGYLFMFYIDTDNSLADVSLEEKIKDFAIYTYWDEFLQAYYSAGGG